MKKVAVIVILCYYLLGSMILPFGDFSKLGTLHGVYTNCKATEDKDLNVFEFLTDHVIDFDCFFDIHEEAEEEEDHTRLYHEYSTNTNQIFHEYYTFHFNRRPDIEVISKPLCSYNSMYTFQSITSIFHPPAVV